MENSYSTVMASLGESELLNYIHYPERFVPEAVEAAAAELQRRGKDFAPDELATLRQKLQQIRQEQKSREEQSSATTINYPPEVPLTDELPEYYSEAALYGFSLLFNPFFAAILLAINCRRAGKKEGVYAVMAFGFLYILLSSFLIVYMKVNLLVSLLFFDFVGAVILHQVFWNRYIGKNVPYRRRPVWSPLLLFLILTIGLSYILVSLLGIKPAV